MPVVRQKQPVTPYRWPYLQIFDDLSAQIARKADGYRQGDQLPNLKQIAASWGVSHETAHRAVTRLRTRGLVTTVDRTGSFVGAPREIPGPRRTPARLRSSPPGSKSRSERTLCILCGDDWPRIGGGQKLCPKCRKTMFWCSRAPWSNAGHIASLVVSVGDNTCRACRLLRTAWHRAKSDDTPFTITWKYVESIWPEDGTCPYLGIQLQHGTGTQCSTSPALDRIDPARGCTQGNIEIISYLANAVTDPHA